MKITPHVSSIEQIETVTQSSNITGPIVALPIISDVGELGPTIVTGKSLLKKYTKDGVLKKSAHTSLFMAYHLSKYGTVVVSRVSNTEVLAGILDTGTRIYVKDNVIYTDPECTTTLPSSTTANFAVISNSPLSYDDYSIEVTKGWESGMSTVDGDGGTTVIVEGTETLGNVKINGTSFEFSLDRDSANGYGVSNFVETINGKQDKVRVLALKTMEDSVISTPTLPSTLFGNSGYDYTKLKDSSVDLIKHTNEALERIQRYRSDLKYKFIMDGGIVSTYIGTLPSTVKSIMATLRTVAEKRKSLGVFTHAKDLVNFNQIRDFYTSIKPVAATSPTNSSFLYSCTPWKRSREIVEGYSVMVPMTLEYVVGVLENARSNNEFAPRFKSATGKVSAEELTVYFEHSDDSDLLKLEDSDPDLPETEALQRLSVNPVIISEATGSAYLVNNLTHQEPNKDEMSDENNRRLFNKIQTELNGKLDAVLSFDNDGTTRDIVLDTVDDYFRLNILTLNRTIDGYRREVSDYDPARRNDLDLSIGVKFRNSTKYINVIYRSIPNL